MNANIDQQELDKFSALASRWWDPESEFKPLHDINPLRLGYIEKYEKNLADKKILDVGCGGGILSESLAQRGAKVTGIDMSETPLNIAKLHLHETGLEVNYRQITVEELATESPNSFDVITCMEMLEHVPDPASVVTSCYKLLKPEGKIFFSTINRNPKSYLFAIIGAEYVLRLLPKGTHDHSKFIRPAELTNWIEASDGEVKDITGMNYNPISKQYSLSNDVSVNYLIHSIKERT
ncbi:bifunctional 2-polyprenyl-6-hydroxyphenol methylase/3-demethylubiquinol 3-O-methyltransferase UbiG [Candidatus Halobeggiatoa sp. HSG11]|nr:bifunctional 2-polyprenyl-6-hydroxyphenol methylase/3-demethylubiquinol 3-O-methyltransferase UbiG [Candidatus Halobeggiatoa sp. HSG11]